MDKSILITEITMSFGLLMAMGKIVIGIFGAMLFLAKLECVLGVKSKKMTLGQRNGMVALFFASGWVYICRLYGKGPVFSL